MLHTDGVHTGPHGRLWPMDASDAADGMHSVAQWGLDAKWAHPMWDQYATFLVTLKPSKSRPIPHLYRQGMTHEVHVYAVDPRCPISPGDDAGKCGVMTPVNHAYQFPADSDTDAMQRIENILVHVVYGEINPDTDCRACWDTLFKDGAGLHIEYLAGMPVEGSA